MAPACAIYKDYAFCYLAPYLGRKEKVFLCKVREGKETVEETKSLLLSFEMKGLIRC